ncbi:MAG: sulfite exporter TauE/SafE family protein [Gammaproteobacteria bacterium]|nr:sulfite exporter TauE/SafE family protein [Gammaproteobacteria bacterium]MDH4253449.1 sulfite exporter TauE/SafE family protein [Gammaproteobacteria bacterium]MDH5309189.1 sulfite exporter TauE/SafE family protein [Gammaproteobacteria bacterium]
MTELLLLALAMLATGAVGGVLAGLLGIGGGIIIVPVLDAALQFLGTDASIRMHVAVATSLATIIPTSIASSRAHYRRGSVDVPLVRRWAPFVLGGSLAGTWIAAQVDSSVLSAVFAAVAFLISIKLLLPLEDRRLAADVPRAWPVNAVPLCIGGVSSMMGIGGGTLSVAALTLFNQPIHRAVGTAALFGLVIALPGTAGFMLSGYGDPRLPPGSVGYVNLVGFALIAPTTVLAAPLGAAIAHRLTARQLAVMFGLFLLLMSVRMAGQAF